MKKWITVLFIAALISGCTTTPTALKPHPEKYTFQVIGIQVSENALRDNKISLENPLSNEEFETLINEPTAQITEYPVVVADVGEKVTNDQQDHVLFPSDYQIVKGKLIPEEVTIGLGLFTEIHANKIHDGMISFDINIENKKLNGWDEYPTEAGIAKMPYFEGRAIKTELTQKPNIWNLMGGLVDQGTNSLIAVRVLPPATSK